MPVYEFKCHSCQNRFDELIMNSNQLNAVQCPKCHANHSERMMSTFGFSTGSSSPGQHHHHSGSSCGSCHSKHCSTCG